MTSTLTSARTVTTSGSISRPAVSSGYDSTCSRRSRFSRSMDLRTSSMTVSGRSSASSARSSMSRSPTAATISSGSISASRLSRTSSPTCTSTSPSSSGSTRPQTMARLAGGSDSSRLPISAGLRVLTRRRTGPSRPVSRASESRRSWRAVLSWRTASAIGRLPTGPAYYAGSTCPAGAWARPANVSGMSVGILLVSHEGVGQPLVAAARRLLGSLPLPTEAFELGWDADPDAALPAASAALRKVDGGEGVLMLVDLYGASPARLAEKLARLGTPARRGSGLSLPMLLRAQNYPEQDLDELARTAAAGGRNGVVVDDA